MEMATVAVDVAAVAVAVAVAAVVGGGSAVSYMGFEATVSFRWVVQSLL